MISTDSCLGSILTSQKFRMKQLTFGVTSSPFLATETLHQVARDHSSSFPQASNVDLNEFYVDDVLTGTQCLKETQEGLRKWRSNYAELLHTIPDEFKQIELNLPKDYLKTLSIHWDTHSSRYGVGFHFPMG